MTYDPSFPRKRESSSGHEKGRFPLPHGRKGRENWRADMALTRSFKQLVQSRVANDPEFSAVLRRESIDTMLAGNVETAEAILRYYFLIREILRF